MSDLVLELTQGAETRRLAKSVCSTGFKPDRESQKFFAFQTARRRDYKLFANLCVSAALRPRQRISNNQRNDDAENRRTEITLLRRHLASQLDADRSPRAGWPGSAGHSASRKRPRQLGTGQGHHQCHSARRTVAPRHVRSEARGSHRNSWRVPADRHEGAWRRNLRADAQARRRVPTS